MAKAGGKGKTTISGGKKGQKPVTFQKGGLHRSLGVPQGQKIPASKMAAAKAGSYGRRRRPRRRSQQACWGRAGRRLPRTRGRRSDGEAGPQDEGGQAGESQAHT